MKNARYVAFAAAAGLLFGACGSSSKSASTTASAKTTAAGAATTAAGATTVALTQSKNITIAVITHGDNGVFWSVAQKGAEQAGKDLGITVKYQGANNDPKTQAQMIDAAVADKVQGLAVSLANPDALKDSVTKAVAAGIPLVTMNSGVGQYKALGAITHVGQTETAAGAGAGERLKAAGGKKLLCVMQEQGNVGLEERCSGAESTFGGTVVKLNTSGDAKPDASQGEIKAKLDADKDIDAIFATGPIGAILAQKAAKELGRKVTIGAVDLSPDLLTAIKAGDIAFTIDQQQYLQGYLSVVFLYLNITNKNTVGGGLPVLTGPGFVDKTNIADVQALVDKGTR